MDVTQIWVVQSDYELSLKTRVTSRDIFGHVSLRTFHAQMKHWLNLPFIFLLPLDLMISEEKIIFLFSIKDMKPVLWFIFIFRVKYFPFIFSISGSRIVIIVSFIFLRTRGQKKKVGNSQILPFLPSLRRNIFGFYFTFAGWMLCVLDVSIDKKKQLSETHQRWQVM